jgi:hypothetical protein
VSITSLELDKKNLPAIFLSSYEHEDHYKPYQRDEKQVPHAEPHAA